MKYARRSETIRDQLRTDLRNEIAPLIIETREKIRVAQGRVCPYCMTRLPRDMATLEHVLPKSRGGLDGPGNYLAVCGPCNSEKGDDMPNGCALVWLGFLNTVLGWEPQTW